MKEAGYINKIIKCSHDVNDTSETVDEIIMGCERGIFLANYSSRVKKLFLMTEERYLEDSLVS